MNHEVESGAESVSIHFSGIGGEMRGGIGGEIVGHSRIVLPPTPGPMVLIATDFTGRPDVETRSSCVAHWQSARHAPPIARPEIEPIPVAPNEPNEDRASERAERTQPRSGGPSRRRTNPTEVKSAERTQRGKKPTEPNRGTSVPAPNEPNRPRLCHKACADQRMQISQVGPRNGRHPRAERTQRRSKAPNESSCSFWTPERMKIACKHPVTLKGVFGINL
jgi:hypothetical protein